MTLFREYLRFFNSGSAWTVYAARNQNLSVPTDQTAAGAHTQKNCCGKVQGVSALRHGHSPLWLIALAFLLTAATPQPTHTLITPGKVALEWTFHDESRVWLEARTYNGAEGWAKEGYHPSFTYLYVKDYVPEVKKIDANHYQITFHSQIATDIP